MTNIKDDDKIEITGSTGIFSTEYYKKTKISSELVGKQDCFDLGSKLFNLKFRENLLKYKKDDEPIINNDTVMEIPFRKHEYIKSRQSANQKFIDFIINLIHNIHYDTNDSPNFDEKYRNKWINKDKEIIEDIVHCNENDEEKISMELQKSDYLINETKILNYNENNFSLMELLFRRYDF